MFEDGNTSQPALFTSDEEHALPMAYLPHSTQDYQHLKGIDLDWNIWTNLMVGSVNIARFALS